MLKIDKQRWAWASAVVVILLVATLGYAGSVGTRRKNTGYANPSLLVSVREVEDQLGDGSVRILDVRRPKSYEAAHIPGAFNFPLAEITRTIDGVPGMLVPVEEIEKGLGRRGITRGTGLVIYDEFGGDRATRLFWVLDYLGHPHVSVLQGGFQLWRREGHPISRDHRKQVAARYRSRLRPERSADRVWIQARLKDTSIFLIDARSPGEFNGRVPGRDVKRGGHIPGAVNVDWVRNLTAGPKKFKSSKDLARLYGNVGATPDKEIVLYCRTGMRASHDYFVLRLLGYPRIRLYDGSYVDWSGDEALPVTRCNGEKTEMFTQKGGLENEC
ncbi:MAG: sulfurtransferase [Candidatus Binatia bacterium]